jgi:diguanylate cyclase (GGDEF)-like protein
MNTQPNQTRKVLLMSGAMLALFAIVAFVDLRLGVRLDPPIRFGFLPLVLSLVVLTLRPINIEVGRGGLFIDLNEIALVISLFCTGRNSLLGATTLGFIIGLSIRQGSVPLKVAFNFGSYCAGYGLAALVFDLLGQTDVENPASWIAAAVAIGAFNAATLVFVRIVLHLSGDPMQASDARRAVAMNLGQSLVTACLGVASLLLLTVHPFTIGLIALLAAGTTVPVRAYTRLRQRHENLKTVHHFAGALRTCETFRSTVDRVLVETQNALNAQTVELIILGNGTSRSKLGDDRSVPEANDWIWNRVVRHQEPVLLAAKVRRRVERDYLAEYGLKDLVAAPMIHEGVVFGALVATGHRYEADTFRRVDLDLLATMANLAATTLQNHDLINQLRIEADTRLHEATHDSLTGLPNRVDFVTRIDGLVRDRRPQSGVALLFIDLNEFKSVNDTLGHHAGDELLVEVAARIGEILPRHWHASRLGGDEFSLAGEFVDLAEVDAVVSALQGSFKRPLDLEGIRFTISAAIGVALAPEHGTQRSTLMRRADVAMYSAKEAKSLHCVYYNADQENVTARQVDLISELRRAIPERGLTLCFQPKAKLTNGVIASVEALARWEHPKYGNITPDEFIPLAEQAGLIGELTDFVLVESMRVGMEWRSRGTNVNIAVNLSARTLRDESFPDRLAAMAAESGFPASSLTLEITEREIMSQADLTITIMKKIRATGVRFSIDDFGTGYSSLVYLTQFPIDEVKIDKTFVRDACDSARHASIVRAVVEVAQTMGLTVVAEGVEDTRTWDTIRSLGCTEAQGFLLSRPVSSQVLEEWLHLRDSNAYETGGDKASLPTATGPLPSLC